MDNVSRVCRRSPLAKKSENSPGQSTHEEILNRGNDDLARAENYAGEEESNR